MAGLLLPFRRNPLPDGGLRLFPDRLRSGEFVLVDMMPSLADEVSYLVLVQGFCLE